MVGGGGHRKVVVLIGPLSMGERHVAQGETRPVFVQKQQHEVKLAGSL